MQNENELDARELETVLAALRMWQRVALTAGERLPEDTIASDNGAQSILQPAEVDELCERLNATRAPASEPTEVLPALPPPKYGERCENQHGFRCPKCGEDSRIAIAAHCWHNLYPDGTDADGDVEWDDDDQAQCRDCRWCGSVGDLTVAELDDDGCYVETEEE